ncbi:MAG: hypothetical protein KAS88_00255 [Deltaproteobacteria bacterium]|nr:hypothetical protein [Deltaproteobacteria bacterium]
MGDIDELSRAIGRIEGAQVEMLKNQQEIKEEQILLRGSIAEQRLSVAKISGAVALVFSVVVTSLRDYFFKN